MDSMRNAVNFTSITLPMLSLAIVCLITGCSSDDTYTTFNKNGIPVGSGTRASVIQQMVDDFSARIRRDEAPKNDWYRVNFFYTTCKPKVHNDYRVGYFELLKDYRYYRMPIKESLYALFHDEYARDFEAWSVRPLVTYTDNGPYRNTFQRIYHPDLNKQCEASSQKLEEAYKQMITDGAIDDSEFKQLETIYLEEKKAIKMIITQIKKSIDDEFKAKKQKSFEDKEKAKQARENGAGVVFYK